MAASAQDVGSVHFELRGPHVHSQTENAGGPYALFGDRDGDYVEGRLYSGRTR